MRKEGEMEGGRGVSSKERQEGREGYIAIPRDINLRSRRLMII